MKNICLLLALTIASLTSYATTYVLYGDAPDGTTDLTSKVTAAAQGTATFEDGVFTGAGRLPGRICETGDYFQMSFTDAQTLTLTDQYALHIVLSKTEGAAGDVQVSFCKNGWNSARTAWTISNADIESGTATDITLRYADCNTGNWNSYAQETFIGTVEYPANEILRICAAAGEQFTISQIYLVSEEEQEEPEPEEPDDNIYRYYLYRGNNTDDLPELEDVTCIDVRPTANAGVACNTATQDTEITDYAQFTVTGTWCAIDHKPATSVSNTINDTYYLVVRFKSNLSDGAFSGNQMRFNLSNGAQNFNINNTDNETYNDEKWHTVTLALKDASGNKPATYLTANQIAFQIHLNGNGESGKYIAIDYAYFTNDISALDEGTVEDAEPEEPEEPDDNIYRYYLYRGNNTTDPLPNVKVTIDGEEKDVICIDVRPMEKATIELKSAERHEDVTDYPWHYSIIGEDHWFVLNHIPNVTIDNAINADYYLVVRFKTNLPDEAFYKVNMRFNLANDAKDFYINTDTETYTDGKWHTVVLPLKDAKINKSNYLRGGEISFQMHLDNGGALNKCIAIDYAYFTNNIDDIDEGTVTDDDTFDIYYTGSAPSDGRDQFTGGCIPMPIQYRHKFQLDTWYSLCLPFNVTAVKVESGGKLYDLNPYYYYSDGTYHTKNYIIRSLDPDESTPEVAIDDFQEAWKDPILSDEEAETFLPQKGVPYIIQFHNTYYEDKWICFFGEDFSYIDKTFSLGNSPATAEVVSVYGNNTMQPATIEDNSYHLNYEEYGGTAWTRYENHTVKPFECYILADAPTTARYKILRRGAGEPQGGITTSDNTLTNDEPLAWVRVYSSLGVLICQYTDKTLVEIVQDLQSTLSADTYLLVSELNTWKIWRGILR